MMGAGATAPSDRDNPGVFRPFNWDAEARSPWDTDRVPGLVELLGGAAATAAWAAARYAMVPTAAARRRLPGSYSGVGRAAHDSGSGPAPFDYEKPTMMLTASYWAPGPRRYATRRSSPPARSAGPHGRDYVCLAGRHPPTCVRRWNQRC